MTKKATLYRMMTDKHICPFGLRSKDLLERQGFEVLDITLNTREQTDNFKQEYGVATTPQAFIDGKRIGGYDALREFFGLGKAGQSDPSYTPVIAIFSIAVLLTLAMQLAATEPLLSVRFVLLFIGFAMALLALQKLQDLFSFTNMFITYDLLAMRRLRYAYVYPFVEAYVGIGMIAELPALAIAPFALLIGSIGAVSVYKAVYVDKRTLKCACAGGGTNVPLGFVSLSENLFMVAGALIMLVQ